MLAKETRLRKQWLRERGIVHLQPLLNQASLYGALEAAVLGEPGGGGVNAWVQADRRWQRPGNFPHSPGASILVAKKCTSIFYRSVGWIPGLRFHVSFIHF